MFLLSVVFSEECDFVYFVLPLSVFRRGANQVSWFPASPPIAGSKQTLFRFVFTAGNEETARIRGPSALPAFALTVVLIGHLAI
jgi:hypothetical protein